MEVLEVVVQVLEQEEALAAARHLRHITQVLQLRPVALEVEGLVMWQAEKDLGVEVVEVMECPVQNTRPQPHEP
jgi:hypothetical protein